MSDTSDPAHSLGQSLETRNSEHAGAHESAIKVKGLIIQDDASTSGGLKSDASGLIKSKLPKTNGVTGLTNQQSRTKKQESSRGGSIRKDVNYAILLLDIVIFVSVSALVLWGFIDPTIYEGSRSLAAPIIVSFFWILLALMPSGRGAWRRWKMRQDPYLRPPTVVNFDVDSSGGGGFYN